jgi:hypothetical protein
MQSTPPPAPISPVWQRIWLRTQLREWTSLAVLGSSKLMPDGAMRVARGLARVSAEVGYELVILDGRAVDLKNMSALQARMRSLAARGTRCIAVLGLAGENAISVPVAQSADAAIMCVFIGETSIVTAEQTIEQVGRDRFLGTVCLDLE